MRQGAAANRAIDILLQGGDWAADAARRRAEIGARLRADVEKLGTQLQERQQRRQASRQESALMQLANSWNGQDPTALYTAARGIAGPERGQEFARSLLAFHDLGRKQREHADETSLQQTQMVSNYLLRLSPENQAQVWGQMRNMPVIQGLAERLGVPEIPEQWSPQVEAMLRALPGVKGQDLMAIDANKRLVDPRTGQVILEGRQKPDARSLEQRIAEAAAAGDTATVQRLTQSARALARAEHIPTPRAPEPLEAVMGPDGTPVLVPRSRAAGMSPARGAGGGRALPSGQSTRIADYDTALDDLNELTGTLGPSQATGTRAKLGAMAPNWLTEWTGIGADAKSKQAVIDRVKQVIGKALEGGVLRKEDEYKYEKILPIISDVPMVVEAKLNGLWTAITKRRQTDLDAFSDAGYDVSKFEARGPRQRRSGGGGTQSWESAKAAAAAMGIELLPPEE